MSSNFSLSLSLVLVFISAIIRFFTSSFSDCSNSTPETPYRCQYPVLILVVVVVVDECWLGCWGGLFKTSISRWQYHALLVLSPVVRPSQLGAILLDCRRRKCITAESFLRSPQPSPYSQRHEGHCSVVVVVYELSARCSHQLEEFKSSTKCERLVMCHEHGVMLRRCAEELPETKRRCCTTPSTSTIPAQLGIAEIVLRLGLVVTQQEDYRRSHLSPYSSMYSNHSLSIQPRKQSSRCKNYDIPVRSHVVLTISIITPPPYFSTIPVPVPALSPFPVCSCHMSCPVYRLGLLCPVSPLDLRGLSNCGYLRLLLIYHPPAQQVKSNCLSKLFGHQLLFIKYTDINHLDPLLFENAL
ncbi:putative signal peptide protein [Puccinia sorghi]|uniref:Putative signal peptide protein n=1 Tax=Puccinia sorghi TaxID=27349 RepID=A0A0L6UTT7_9BASI|nr:putative signal peptide protein [Puccinia sorghi]